MMEFETNNTWVWACALMTKHTPGYLAFQVHLFLHRTYHYLVTPDNAFDSFSSVHSPISHLISPINHLINLPDHLIGSIDHLITWLPQIMLILHALFFKFSCLCPMSNLYTLVSHSLTAFSTSSMFTSLGTCLLQNFWLLILTLSHENKTMVSWLSQNAAHQTCLNCERKNIH